MKYQTDTYSARVRNVDGNKLAVEINEQINLERLKTIYDGYVGPREVEIRFTDPRKFTKQQRYFFFALVNDINTFTGQPRDDLKEMFYFQYEQETGREISLKDTSNASVSDVVVLTDLVIDFIFENDIPFKDGYEILPGHIDYYFYKCVMNRVCCICGKHNADIDHFSKTVGMGNNRDKVDGEKYDYAALCREHHTIKHSMPLWEFKDRYKVKGVRLTQEEIEKIRKVSYE
ncbi:hypothetical protein BG261_05450 [Floricoccus tropicus]|uniref:Uncharacterized protein n=1 Tax=Floricoccus tropicus TaxID=1859473 RepID=A0A1E8GKQ3_9LACT|nr:putative HNHc nuclease [Floricoccus tropicus]OFI48835.1 hypothetical protein BG261_05450 [Floricoccus tropicus]